MKQKEIRKLLRPTAPKVALFLLIFVIFIPFAEFDSGIRCITTPCPSGSVGSVLAYAFSFHGAIYQFYYFSIAVGLVASYLISCLLFSLAGNARSKSYTI